MSESGVVGYEERKFRRPDTPSNCFNAFGIDPAMYPAMDPDYLAIIYEEAIKRLITGVQQQHGIIRPRELSEMEAIDRIRDISIWYSWFLEDWRVSAAKLDDMTKEKETRLKKSPSQIATARVIEFGSFILTVNKKWQFVLETDQSKQQSTWNSQDVQHKIPHPIPQGPQKHQPIPRRSSKTPMGSDSDRVLRKPIPWDPYSSDTTDDSLINDTPHVHKTVSDALGKKRLASQQAHPGTYKKRA